MWRTVLLCLLLPLAACLPKKEREVIRLSGPAMGTQYHIIAIGEGLEAPDIEARVETVLASLNASLSNWNPASEVSRFSAAQTTEAQDISPDFAKVMAGATEVNAQSGGIFDVTLSPLIDLWGFGARKPEDPVPSDADIAMALTHVGQARLLTFDAKTRRLAKAMPEVQVNVSGIAKGYGIDALAGILTDAGIEDFMVEVGGDLVTRGLNDKGKPWQIGIETPQAGRRGGVEKVIALSGHGMATSGDYRNFFERGGKRYSHILDPTTGRPVTHRTTSATVIAKNAMMADAWATAMLALGAERGLEIAERHGIAVLFISHMPGTEDGNYKIENSSTFDRILEVE